MTTVLVTRPAHQADLLCNLLAQQGIDVVRLPLIDIEPISLTEPILQALSRPPPIDWIIFISANAVNFALAGNNGKIHTICQHARVAAVGRATAEALKSVGVAVDLLPEQGFNSEALLASPKLQQPVGQRIVIVRGVGGRELLAETLRARGAVVDYLEVYTRQVPTIDPSRLITSLQQQGLTVFAVTSAEALQNLVAIRLEPVLQQLLYACPLVVLSDRLQLTAMALGFKTVVVSQGVSDQAVFNTIVDLVSGEYSG